MKRPRVILVAAISLDGRIAQIPGQSTVGWTSKEDKIWFAKISKKIGILIMGRRTFATIKKSLKDRRIIVLTRHPQDYAALSKVGVLEFTASDPEEILKQLANENVKSVLLAGGSQIYSRFLQKRLVDEIWLTVEPKIFGQGVPFLESKLPTTNLRLLSWKKLNPGTPLLHYQIVK